MKQQYVCPNPKCGCTTNYESDSKSFPEHVKCFKCGKKKEKKK